MNRTMKRRIPLLVPVAAAVALSLSACGHLSYNSDAGNSTPASGTASGSGLSSGQSGQASGSAGGSTSGTAGQSGISGGGSSGSTTGSTGTDTVGLASSDPASAAGMTPDQTAKFCKSFTSDPDYSVAGLELTSLRKMRDVAPVQYDNNIDVLLTDYDAINSGKRQFLQVRSELVANYDPLKKFRDQICK